MTPPGARLVLPLRLGVFALYLALLPWTSQVWLKTGDEPHYLVAAASVARDGDFDLGNNYDPAVYLDWYTASNLTPHVKTRGDGAEFLIHTYGLPLLIAPAYWLAGVRGVGILLAGLGAILAGEVYLLSYQVTRDWRASLLGSLVVALSPPVIWYVFLVYPELPGALAVVIAIRVLINPAPGWRAWLAFGLSLGAMPWLSARFLPVVVVLGALGVWKVIAPSMTTVGARRPQGPLQWQSLRSLFRPSLTPLLIIPLSLLGLTLFNATLYSHPAPTASYAGQISNPAALSWPVALQFARGVLGWLMDHQRGLLVAAPVYLAALIGLGQWLRRREWEAVVVALPFLAALGGVALFGGFWIGVEPAARYLVYVLPPLGAALAYAWVHRRGPWLAGLTALTLAASLWTGWQVFAHPLLAQTGDLLGERAAWLAPYLPAMGAPTYLAPDSAGVLLGSAAAVDPVVSPVPAGQPGTAFRQETVSDFSFGWYEMRLHLSAQGAAADAQVARVLLKGGDDTPLLSTILYGRDFPAGGDADLTFSIFNPVYNQWEQPPGLFIFTTGQAELALSQVTILPETFHSLVLPALWLAGLALIGVLVGSQFNPHPAAAPEPRWLGSRAGALAALVLVAGVSVWSLRTLPRTFAVADLRHFVGDVTPSSSGTALSAPAEAGGVLAATHPEFFPAGRYRWRLMLKAGAAPAGETLATVRIRWSRAPIANETTPISSALVPADGQFHPLALEFDNPIRQALVFELNNLGTVELSTQAFEVRPLP